MTVGVPRERQAAERLAAFYELPFGGKPRGRYRVSAKLLRALLGRRRVWPEQVEAMRREMYELGFTLVDQETHYVVISNKTFGSYRRINEAVLLVEAMESKGGEASYEEEDAVA